jgi:hypothetical protein
VVTEGEVGGVEMLRAGAWGWLNLGGEEKLERVCLFEQALGLGDGRGVFICGLLRWLGLWRFEPGWLRG